MNFFHSASIKGKLLACFCTVMLFSCTVSGIAISSMFDSISTAELLQQRIIGSFARITKASAAVEKANESMIVYLTPGGQLPQNERVVVQDLSTMIEEVNHLKGLEPETANAVKTFKEDAQKFADLFNLEIRNMINADRPDQALEHYLHVMAPLISDVSRNVDVIVAFRVKTITDYAAELIQTTAVTIVLVLTIVQVIVSLMIAVFIANFIQNSISEQVTNLKRIANGDFTLSFKTSSHDEFGVLNDTMRNMTEKLRTTLTRVVNLSTQISKSMDQVERSSSNICNSMNSAESQAVTVAAAADQMVATTANIAKNCSDAAKSSQDSSDLTHKGMSLVNDASKAIMEQYEQMKDNAAAMQTLVDQAQTIGSIVGTIDEIAAQTNLLALNAAIEAARAGSAGRGFAVVADEVRALATRTTASTTEIRGMVARIQAQTSHATEAMQSNLESMSTVAKDSVHVQETLESVLNFVQDVNSQITQIATAAEEQSSASAEISNNMQEITRTSGDVNNIAQDARDLSVNTAHDLDTLLEDLKFFKI